MLGPGAYAAAVGASPAWTAGAAQAQQIKNASIVNNRTLGKEQKMQDQPDTELIFWRNRMAKFNGVAEQLKSKEARFVLGVAQTAKRQRFKQ